MKVESFASLMELGNKANADARVGDELEATFLRALLRESGAFQGEGTNMAADMALDVMSDAIARMRPMGIADAVMGKGSHDPRHLPASPLFPSALPPVAPGAGSAIPDLDTALLVDSEEARVSSAYGDRRDPIHGDHAFHHGVDVAAPEGSAIRSVKDGKVVFAGDRGGYGLVVEVQHEGGAITRYAHASEALVKEGDVVRAGDAIARVGTSGRSTGPHLHFELIEDNARVDPVKALKAYGIRADDPVIRAHPGPGRTFR